MVNLSRFLSCIWLVLFSIIACEDIRTPQGDVSIAELRLLQSAHGVAVNQKDQERLFLSLPLVATNDTSLVAAGNTSGTDVSLPKIRYENQSPGNLSKRADTKCNNPLRWEGDDGCRGYENQPGYVRCRPLCEFTRDYFMQIAVRKPKVDECVFYTSGLSAAAQKYVALHNSVQSLRKLTSIWEIWDSRWMPPFEDQLWDNDLRCIVQVNVLGRRNPFRQNYFSRMSDAMAYMCGGRAAVMDRNIRHGRKGKVDQTGIWHKVEFPRLMQTGAGKWTDDAGVNRVVHTIDAIGENDLEEPDTWVWWAGWWTRGGKEWPNELANPIKRRDLDRRETTNATSMRHTAYDKRAIQNSAIFDEGGALEVDW